MQDRGDIARGAPVSYETYRHAEQLLRRARRPFGQPFWYREPGLWLPLSCAIGFDASSSGLVGVGSSSITVSHTTTGSNLILWVGVLTGTGNLPAVTYNGVSMSEHTFVDNNGYETVMFYLIAPASGTHDIVVTLGSGTNLIDVSAASYTGAQQSGVPDADNTAEATGSTLSCALTPVADNCWEVGVATGGANTAITLNSGSFNTRQEQHGPFDQICLFDFGPISPASSQTLDVNMHAGSTFPSIILSSFAPAGAAVVVAPTLIGPFPTYRPDRPAG